MNKKRRELLRSASELLTSASVMVATALDGEEDALSNMPENLFGSEQYDKIESAVDLLNDASESIDTAIEKIRDASA